LEKSCQHIFHIFSYYTARASVLDIPRISGDFLLEFCFYLRLVVAAVIHLRFAETQGSGRVGVIDALRLVLFWFHLRPSGRAATERFIAQLPRAHWSGPEE